MPNLRGKHFCKHKNFYLEDAQYISGIENVIKSVDLLNTECSQTKWEICTLDIIEYAMIINFSKTNLELDISNFRNSK